MASLSPDPLPRGYSGMRPQEYLALGKSALRKDGVFIDRAIDGSGSRIKTTKTPSGRRFIEISPDVMDMVRHYAVKHAVNNDHALVFPTSNGKWLCRRNWQRRGFNIACEQAGLMETVKEDGKAVTKDGSPYCGPGIALTICVISLPHCISSKAPIRRFLLLTFSSCGKSVANFR